LNLLYGLYNVKYINTNPTMSLNSFIEFLLNDVMKNPEYSSNFDETTTSKLNTINGVIKASLNNTEYAKDEMFAILNSLGEGLDKDTVDLLYIYYGSSNEYDNNWTLTVEKLVNFLNDDILNDNRFNDFIENDMRENLADAKDSINDAKELLIGNGYSRLIINTKLPLESEETFNFVQSIKDDLGVNVSELYVIGDSPMAYEMSQTFQSELDFITVLTMIAIFVVVAITFKSAIIPFILVLLIQCAVYTTMGLIAFSGEGVYFIALLIVQSILMGATIDYAILYTTYYIEHRKTMDIKEAIISSYNKSINTILTSSSILVIATFVIAIFSSGIISKICMVLSQGTLCAALLILILLPAMIAACDKLVIKTKKK
ncbi:MAG: MMPL family transporter, partial [Clostridia bacterium]